MAILMRNIICLTMILSTIGCVNPTASSERAWFYSGCVFRNLSPQRLEVEEFDMNLDMKVGGNVLPFKSSGQSAQTTADAPPSQVDIHWKYGDRQYRKNIKISPPIQDLRLLSSIVFNFNDADCVVTYQYTLGLEEDGILIEVDERGVLTKNSMIVIALLTYYDPDLHDEFIKRLKSKGKTLE